MPFPKKKKLNTEKLCKEDTGGVLGNYDTPKSVYMSFMCNNGKDTLVVNELQERLSCQQFLISIPENMRFDKKNI